MATIEGNFDRSELYTLIHDDTGQLRSDIDEVFKSATRNLIEKVSELGYAEVDGFGSFRVVELAPESGIGPQGNPYDVGKRVTVEFNPFKEFRDKLEALTGYPAIR